MPECHKCPHDGKGDRACLKCSVSLDTKNGQNFVSVDAIQGTRFEPRALPQSFEAEASDDFATRNEVFLDFIRKLMLLSPRTLLVVQARFVAGMSRRNISFESIGRALHMSKQAVFNRLVAAQQEIPGLAAVFQPKGKDEVKPTDADSLGHSRTGARKNAAQSGARERGNRAGDNRG